MNELINPRSRPIQFNKKAVLLLAAMVGFFLCLNGEDSLEMLQEAAQKWIDIRLKTAQLQSDWSWQKDLLESTRDSLQFNVEQLKTEEAMLQAQTEADRAKLADKRVEVESMQAQLEAYATHNQDLIGSLQSMRPLLPPRLSKSLDLAYMSLSKTNLPPGDRMQLIATILNRCLQFNNTITYSEEIIPVNGDTKQRVMSVLYWGLGQAYALDRANEAAYVGRPGTEHWEWTLAEGAGPEIQQLIDMFLERSDPALVQAPIHIQSTNRE